MKLHKRLKNALTQEFQSIRDDILKIVVLLVAGKERNSSSEEIFKKFFGNSPETISDEERDDMVYETALTCAREICNNQPKLEELEGVISRMSAKTQSAHSERLQIIQNVSTDPSTSSNKNSFFASASSNTIELGKKLKEKPEKHVSFEQDKLMKKRKHH